MTTTTTTTTTANNSSNTSSGNSISAPPMSSAPALSSSDKSLQFNRVTKVYLVPCIDELTDEEYDTLWPTEEDSQQSRQHLAETLQALHLNNGEVPRHLEGQITSRGVESFLASITSDPNSLDHPRPSRIATPALFWIVKTEPLVQKILLGHLKLHHKRHKIVPWILQMALKENFALTTRKNKGP